MTKVTLASIAYITTQVCAFFHKLELCLPLTIEVPKARFALSSSPVFTRTDLTTDSERFYNTVLDLFEDIDEREEVADLLAWWNRCVLSSAH